MSGNQKGGIKFAERMKAKDPDYFKKIGAKGGKNSDHSKSTQTTRERYGDDFFSEAGKLGAKIKALKKSSLKKTKKGL